MTAPFPPLWYLATPYSKHPLGHVQAYQQACHMAASLMKAGHKLFCPIAHTHPLSSVAGLVGDHDFWMAQDKPLVDRCDGLIVGLLTGWRDSKGVQQEIGWFRDAGKPVLACAYPEFALVGFPFYQENL